MVSTAKYHQEIVLFHAGQSLVLQVADWTHRHSRARCADVSRTAIGIAATARTADVVIVDATESPGEALDAVSLAVTVLGCDRVAIYTERASKTLELLSRMRGVRLLTSPMSQFEWAAFFMLPALSGKERLGAT